MTDVDVLQGFETCAIPEVVYETPYTKIVKAAKLLKNDSALKIPRALFKTKNFKASLISCAKRLGTKVKAYEKDGVVYVWEVRN